MPGIRFSLVLSAALICLCGCGGNDPDTLVRDAASAAAAGRWSQALELTGQALKNGNPPLNARILHGLSLHQMQESAEAAEVLQKAANKAPEDFAAQFFCGYILCENQRYADALPYLRAAYDMRKDHPDLLVLLARACLRQNLSEGMRYLQALRRFPRFRNGPEIYNGLAMLAFGEQNYLKAAEYYLQAHGNAPQNPAILQNLAVLHDQYLGDPQKALKYYRLCLLESQRASDRQRGNAVRSRLRQMARERATEG
jgi:tetratricopeptide (TPR) repeat protein